MSGGFRSRASGAHSAQSAQSSQSTSRGAEQSARGDRTNKQTPAKGAPGGASSRRRSDRGQRGQRGGSNGQDHRGGRSGRGVNPSKSPHVGRRPGVDVPREIAAHVIHKVTVDGAYANLLLPSILREENLSARDRSFATELTYGTLRARGVCDAIIAQCSSRALDSLDAAVLDMLRLGVYQLVFTRVQAHAAVDTTVRLVEFYSGQSAKGFANAVMRAVTRRGADEWINAITKDLGEVEALALRHAHPAWIARSFAAVLPADELADALEADSVRPVVHLVARPGEISADELAAVTGGDVGRYSPYAVYLTEGGNPGDCDAVREAIAAVQDEGSQIIARAVTVAPLVGDDRGRWLDLCAGPGGKAALMGAIAAIEGAHVDAVEVAEHRAQLVRQATRGLPVTVIVGDGRSVAQAGTYDRVLVDAPCSGLGSLRRRPEARWTKKPQDLHELPAVQYELLAAAIAATRPGGIVVYSTCSPDLSETRAVVDRAVGRLPVEELDASSFACGMTDTGQFASVQMWPHRHGTDAMFFAVLRVTGTTVDTFVS